MPSLPVNAIKRIPNILTGGRIALVPLIVLLFSLTPGTINTETANNLALAVFFIAGVTDWLDGYIARRFNATSDFGATFDPIADKLLVTVMLVLFVKLRRADLVIVSLLISREIIMSGFREWMTKAGRAAAVKVSNLGKYKTTFQMLAIGFLIANRYSIGFGVHTYHIGNVLLVIAAILSIVSLLDYFYRALYAPALKQA